MRDAVAYTCRRCGRSVRRKLFASIYIIAEHILPHEAVHLKFTIAGINGQTYKCLLNRNRDVNWRRLHFSGRALRISDVYLFFENESMNITARFAN